MLISSPPSPPLPPFFIILILFIYLFSCIFEKHIGLTLRHIIHMLNILYMDKLKELNKTRSEQPKPIQALSNYSIFGILRLSRESSIGMLHILLSVLVTPIVT